MKKTIMAIALLLMAGSTFAASVSWKISGTDYIDFGTDFLDDDAATVNIVYLGSSSLDSISFADVVAMSAVSTDASFHTEWGAIPPGKTITTDTTQTGNYAAYITYLVGSDTYYNVSSSTYELTESAITAQLNEGTPIPTAEFAFSSAKNDESATPTKGGGWYASVPEPSVAIMGLLGLGMLLKRRRA